MSTNGRSAHPERLQELCGLVATLCDAELSHAQSARLEELVCSDTEYAKYYVHAMEVDTNLPEHVGFRRGTDGIKFIAEWQSRENDFWSDVVGGIDSHHEEASLRRADASYYDTNGSQRSFFNDLRGYFQHASPRIWALLIGSISATLVALLLVIVYRDVGRATSSAIVASLTRSQGAVWALDERIAAETPLHAGRRLSLLSGIIQVRFASGATTFIEGPATFEVQSSSQGLLTRGRLVAIVPAAAKGFAVETGSIRIVDLGTEFGIDVEDNGNASVHVLTGAIEAYVTNGGVEGAPVRLAADHAVRYDATAHSFGRVPIDRVRFGSLLQQKSSSPIASVTTSSGKNYSIVHRGLQPNDQAYLDRTQRWTEIPRELIGAPYIVTANNDKSDPQFEMTVTLASPASLYVFFDDRAHPPEWLIRDFSDTGLDLALNTTTDGAQKDAERAANLKFSIWKRSVGIGPVKLGPTLGKGVGHYGIAAVAEATK